MKNINYEKLENMSVENQFLYLMVFEALKEIENKENEEVVNRLNNSLNKRIENGEEYITEDMLLSI